MIQYFLWVFTFFSLWLTLIWLGLLFEKESRPRLRKHPRVTLVVPAYNEAKAMPGTIRSLAKLNWPRSKLDIIVVDDGSTDDTAAVARDELKKLGLRGRVIRQANQGKSAALNHALRFCTAPYFACLDADTVTRPNGLRNLVAHFSEPNMGAVVSVVKLHHPRTMWEKFQAVEYVISNLLRRLMSMLGTLSITHGALCVFSTDVLRKVGGFAEGAALTEDLEIALRLRSRGYGVKIDWHGRAITRAPATFMQLWRQRMRWYRGYFYNHWKYRNMFFNRKYGLLGMFQLPANFLMVVLLVLAVGLVSYGTVHDAVNFIIRAVTIKGYLWNHFLDFPTLKQFLLGQNVQIYLPIVLAGFLGFVLLVAGYRQLQASALKRLHHIIAYIFIGPYLASTHWVTAFAQEVLRIRRRWR